MVYYIRAFDKMIDERRRRGLSIGDWTTGENVMKWWLGYNPMQMQGTWMEEV